jgi:hypothetical protein
MFCANTVQQERGSRRKAKPATAKDTRAGVALAIVSDMRSAGVQPNADSYFSLIQLIHMSGTPSAMHDTLAAMKVRSKHWLSCCRPLYDYRGLAVY